MTNPLDEDPVLKDLLKKLDLIETRRGFAIRTTFGRSFH
jgi:hypothetical protein